MTDPNTTPALDTVTPEIELPVVTKDTAKAEIKLALTKAEMNLQAIQDKADKLIYNEDHIAEIDAFITSIKTANKQIETAHKVGKKPFKERGDAWDAAKNDLLGLLSPILNKADKEYTKLCQAVEKRKAEATAKEAKEKAIKEGMDNNVMSFSQRIADCTTNEQLLDVERLINLEKTRKEKYGDFAEEMITRLNELTPLVTAQKKVVKELTLLDKEHEAAIESGDDEKLEKILEKKEELTGKIHENKIIVQETASNQATLSNGRYLGGYKPIYPEVKAKRRAWKTELVSPELAVKNDLSLLRIELNPETVKARMEELKKEGKLKEEIAEDFTEHGIHYYLDKTY